MNSALSDEKRINVTYSGSLIFCVLVWAKPKRIDERAKNKIMLFMTKVKSSTIIVILNITVLCPKGT